MKSRLLSTIYKGSAMPSAVSFSVLMLVVGMVMIMVFGFSLERIGLLEEREQAKAAFHAFGLQLMTDTSLVVDDSFSEYKVFNGSKSIVEARIVLHGLYGLLEMKYVTQSGIKESSARLVGAKGLPYDNALVVPSSGAGYISLGKDCCFQMPVMVPEGIYREIQTRGKQRKYEAPTVLSSPESLPGLSSSALHAAKRIFDECDQDVVMLDSNDTVPDLIVSARVIKVDSSFCNSVQLFASDSVIMMPGSVLKYPSGIFVNSSKGHIKVDSFSVVEGYVIIKDIDDDGLAPSLEHLSCHICCSGVVRGLLYVNSTAQINGHITGSAYVRTPIEMTDKGVSRMTLLRMTQTKNRANAYPLLFKGNQCIKMIKDYEPPL